MGIREKERQTAIWTIKLLADNMVKLKNKWNKYSPDETVLWIPIAVQKKTFLLWKVVLNIKFNVV